MSNEILYVLLPDFASHEMVYLMESISSDESQLKSDPKYINKIVAPTMAPVTAIGGFRVLPDYSFENMPEDYSALVLIGGYGWLTPVADMVAHIVRKALENGKIVGAICNGASFMAKHGFLNGVKHTGNGIEQLRLWGAENYTYSEGYIHEQAVSDRGIVTANGSGVLEFTKELLLLLENDTPERIEMYYQFNKQGFCALFPGKKAKTWRCIEMERYSDIMVREIKNDEIPLLIDFLYEAIFQPDNKSKISRTVLQKPMIWAYIDRFGTRSGDCGHVALVDGVIVGAVWSRLGCSYGKVDNNTLELAMSVYQEYRNYGIGSRLLASFLGTLREKGFTKVSLSVDKTNYAVKMYRNFGFEIITEREHDYLMIKKF